MQHDSHTARFAAHAVSPVTYVHNPIFSAAKSAYPSQKNGSDTRFFRLFSANLIGNFLAHHMYFPGRSLFRLFYYFKSLFSLRKTEYEKPRDIIRPGSVLIGHGTIGI